MQRFVRFSADLARQVGVMLENLQHVTSGQVCYKLIEILSENDLTY